jgi:hypothetical protein
MAMTDLTSAFLGVLVASALPADRDRAERAAPDFQWSGAVAAGKSVEIKGINGAIEATRAAGDHVEVVAHKYGRRDDPASVEIKVVPHEGGVTICALYPSPWGKPNECAPGARGRLDNKDNDVAVDFSVRVPAGVAFAAKTVNGSVTATDLGSDVHATTVNGGIRVETEGRARAETVNGSARARLGRADGAEPLEFRTVNGSLRVELPEDAAADVDIATVNGSITTDFPLTIRGKWGPRKARGTIGGGGRELSLETVNGSVELRKTR